MNDTILKEAANLLQTARVLYDPVRPTCFTIQADEWLQKYKRQVSNRKKRERSSIDLRFQKFHQNNPEVWEEFTRIALNQLGQGRKLISAKAIYEKIRHERTLRINGQLEEFALPNEFTSRYARMFVKTYPQYSDTIDIRKAPTLGE